MLVRATRPVRLECVVRGYVFGHGWSEYRESGHDRWPAARRPGCRRRRSSPSRCSRPTTKAETGHDEALDPDEADRVGRRATATTKLRELSLRLYEFGARHATSCGVILADTKFEFGELDGEILLIDEVMTPDSSRYWPADSTRPGGSPPSFDKQFVRDYMDSVGWDRESPPPHLPADVIENTRVALRRGLRADHRA